MGMKLQNQQSTPTKRMVYLDILRILAIVLVIFYHTNYKGFSFFTSAEDSLLFPFYLFCAVFSRTAVPLFFMVSGALLLKKEEPIPVILKKRFLKYAVVLTFASLVIYVEKNLSGEMSLKGFVRMLYATEETTQLWYLYTYLGLILSLPFMRKLSKNMKPADYMYLTCIMLLFSGLEIFDYVATRNAVRYNGDFQVVFTWTMVYYPLMGDFLANKLPIEKVTGKKMLGVAGLGVLAIAVSGLLTCVLHAEVGDWNSMNLEQFFATLIYLPTCAAFLGVRFLCSRWQMKAWLEKTLVYIGSCTFGVYLFEILYRKYTAFVYDALILHVPCYVACFAWIACVMLLGIAVTSVLKKIPLIRNLV